jgi:hypothetical protein
MSSKKITDDNYKRPAKTYTDRLDDDDIEDKLSDYVKVDDIMTVNTHAHLRYFTLELDKKSGTMKRLFRMGGFLAKKDENKQYVVLTNGRMTWTVQIANTVFYRRLTVKEIKEEYEQEVGKLQLVNKKLLKQNQKLKDKLKELGYEVR